MTKLSTLLAEYVSSGNLDKYADDIQTMASNYRLWIFDYPLEKIVIYVHIIYLSNPNLINGEILGVLAKRLIESELNIGGPYISLNDVYLNTLIAHLFQTFGSPLPNVEKYLLNRKLVTKTKFQENATKLSKPAGKNTKRKDEINQSFLIVREEVSRLEPDIRELCITFVKKIISLDVRSEISLLSFYFVSSLLKDPNEYERTLSNKLGAANIYAWMAYTIYDDFIDEEGSPEQLSLANIMHRISYQTYTQIFPNQIEFINYHYESVDNSNYWEVKNCRFVVKDKYITIKSLPQYNNGSFLAQRSVGHVLGPRLILKHYKTSVSQQRLVHEALNCYLIAKQIGDDIKDWKQDLANGHISYVVSKILKSANINYGKYRIEELIKRLQQNFWDSVLEECLLEIISNVDLAKSYLLKSKILKEKNVFLKNILEPIMQTARSDIEKHLNDKNFLKAYSSS